MSSSQQLAQQLKTALSARASEYHICAYSGRFMYGTKCLVVECDSPLNLLMQMAENDPALLNTLGQPKTESLGLGFICYWPSVEGSCEEIECS